MELEEVLAIEFNRCFVDTVVIDVGLKTEGRIPLKEFGISGRAANLSVGDEVDERIDQSVRALYGRGCPGMGVWVAA